MEGLEVSTEEATMEGQVATMEDEDSAEHTEDLLLLRESEVVDPP